MKKAIQTVHRIVSAVFTVLLIATALLLIVGLLFSSGQSGGHSIAGYHFGRVVSPSMEPEIPTGSFLLTKETDPSALSVGEDILFQSDDPDVPQGIPVVHRIQSISEDENGQLLFTTKGIANPSADPYPAREAAVIGRVVWHSTVIGQIVSFSQQWFVFPSLITLLAGLCIWNGVVVIKEARRMREENKATACEDENTTD